MTWESLSTLRSSDLPGWDMPGREKTVNTRRPPGEPGCRLGEPEGRERTEEISVPVACLKKVSAQRKGGVHTASTTQAAPPRSQPCPSGRHRCPGLPPSGGTAAKLTQIRSGSMCSEKLCPGLGFPPRPALGEAPRRPEHAEGESPDDTPRLVPRPRESGRQGRPRAYGRRHGDRHRERL